MYRHVRCFFKRCCFLFTDVLCLIVGRVFFFGDGIVRIRTCIIWLIDCVVWRFFLLLIEFVWNALHLALVEIFRYCTVGWCTCVVSIAFWLGAKFSWCTCNQEWLKLGEIIGDWFCWKWCTNVKRGLKTFRPSICTSCNVCGVFRMCVWGIRATWLLVRCRRVGCIEPHSDAPCCCHLESKLLSVGLARFVLLLSCS